MSLNVIAFFSNTNPPNL